MKLLLNAESFGFGPSAAMSVIFSILKDLELNSYNDNNINKKFQIDYIGQGHTLDLQSELPYNKIYVYENELQFKSIVKEYDYFLTALDFEKIKYAKDVNVKTIFYDTLLWYWKKEDLETISKSDYYIGQDFYRVKELVKILKIDSHHKFIIEPLIQKKEKIKAKENLLLINFGGLENPYWKIDTTVKYINIILTELLPIIESKFDSIQVVCSKNHIQYLTVPNNFNNLSIKTVSYKEMQNLLKRASYIIATPGLGNIYEIANYEIPSLFLPPINDSQGQQLELLKKYGLIDNAIDWIDCNNESINYFENQSLVLTKIKKNLDVLCHNKLKEQFESKLNELNFKSKNRYKNKNIKNLFTDFGFNGKIALTKILNDILKIKSKE